MPTSTACSTTKTYTVPRGTDLPDINVWLALDFEDHPHHRRASRYWYEEAREQVSFCRTTALGFLRLCCNPLATGNKPLSSLEAWDRYQSFRRLPEIQIVAEPLHCEDFLQGWVTPQVRAPGFWTDAYLAAFALAGGLRLVSFDAGLANFDGLDFLLLS